jgi:hypothetical protein
MFVNIVGLEIDVPLIVEPMIIGESLPLNVVIAPLPIVDPI